MNNNESFVFKEQLSDIRNSSVPEPDRDLEQELFGKKGIKVALDSLEQSLGYGEKEKKVKVKVYNKIFSPDTSEDKKLLDELLNDPRFEILRWVDSWTAHGHYKVFIIYSENLELRPVKAKDTEDDDDTN